MTERFDVVVVGAGMAGASLAAAIAPTARVLVIEAEERAGMHATGRSAALYAPSYGSGAIRVLTQASKAVLYAPPADPSAAPFVTPRPSLIVARAEQLAQLEAVWSADPATFDRMDGAEAERMVPVLRPGLVRAALIDRHSGDIDVDALHQAYLGAFRRAGGVLALHEPVVRLEAEAKGWRVVTASREIVGAVVVNAAGAWADRVASMAGLSPIGLRPKRRTAALVDAPAVDGVAAWPAVMDVGDRFYFKPDAGRLLVSPAEETDVEPHDAYADDEALAEGIERIAQLTTIEVTRAPRAWAGLRTFAPDRVPVIGFDSGASAPFFWLAGQGGYGIQTAPAIAALAAALLSGGPRPAFADDGLLAALSPSRVQPS
jgi:D-arginine dehydrogenase